MARIGLLSLLPRLFDRVYVPPAVISEATQDSSRPGGQVIRQALIGGLLVEKQVTSSPELAGLTQMLDEGEAEVLTLARELQLPVLIDERKGRRVAARIGIAVIGTGAVLIAAKQAGLIPAVAPHLDHLKQHGYRLSASLVATILQRCDED